MSTTPEQNLNMELLKEARLHDDNLMQLHRESIQKKSELANILEGLKNRILLGKEMGYYPSKIVSVHLVKVLELHHTLVRLQEAEVSEFLRYLDEAYDAAREDV